RKGGRHLRRTLRVGPAAGARWQDTSAFSQVNLGASHSSSRGVRMSPISRRHRGTPGSFLSGPLIGLGVVVAAAIVLEVLWGVGLLDVSYFRSRPPSTAGLVAIPTAARPIPAYARVTRDYLWDTRKNGLSILYLPPRSVTKEMITSISDVIGRVVSREKPPGYVFTDSDFLP